MGTKNNPGQFDCYAAADDDEPIFVLRANDPLAPLLVREWANRYYDEKKPTTRKKVDEARACAIAMELWAWNHPEMEIKKANTARLRTKHPAG